VSSCVERGDKIGLIVAHYRVPVKPGPVLAAPAATLVLLRDRPAGGPEVLLTQRHRGSRFAGGDYVFPGGRIAPGDMPGDAAAWCAGLTPATAARALGLDDPRVALGFWVGAIREAFEEVGVLLARDAAGAPVTVADPRFASYRARCQAGDHGFWEMLRAERLILTADGLRYFAHWITPEENPVRFDTRFFAAVMPAGQEPVADGREIVDLRWLAPEEALAAFDRGELPLRLPTRKNLALFAGVPSAAEALARLAGREVPTIRPRVVMENGQRRAILPGEPGWF
jgi:8-oxo-dGTP pyrophosphatase MutT (NUDIX family)